MGCFYSKIMPYLFIWSTIYHYLKHPNLASLLWTSRTSFLECLTCRHSLCLRTEPCYLPLTTPPVICFFSLGKPDARPSVSSLALVCPFPFPLLGSSGVRPSFFHSKVGLGHCLSALLQ